MSRYGVTKLKAAIDSDIKQMERRLETQAKKLRQLEARLKKEKQDKANLEADFQHVLDQLHMLSHQQLVFN